jgi:hypothetical protein
MSDEKRAFDELGVRSGIPAELPAEDFESDDS